MTSSRISKLHKNLQENNIDALFVSAIPTITYLTGFAGFDNEDRNAFLLITPTSHYIFTHGIYKEAAQNYIKDFTLIDIARESPMSSSLAHLIKKHAVKRLGFEAADLTYLEYISLTKKIDKNILIPADVITENIRVKKSEEEIAAIAKACALGDKAFAYLLTKIKTGITEKELALEYELFIRKQGAHLSFDTIVAFGSNGSLPHHIPTDRKLTKNTFIVLDFGVKIAMYCSDMTRTVFFGKATVEQKKIYTTVLHAQQKAIDYILNTNEHISAKHADTLAREYILSQGYPDMPHSLGHGIGLLVHEQPRLTPYSKDILSQGMVFSVEPGIYLPGNQGVRIEDLMALRKSGKEILTKAPKHLIELS